MTLIPSFSTLMGAIYTDTKTWTNKDFHSWVLHVLSTWYNNGGVNTPLSTDTLLRPHHTNTNCHLLLKYSGWHNQPLTTLLIFKYLRLPQRRSSSSNSFPPFAATSNCFWGTLIVMSASVFWSYFFCLSPVWNRFYNMLFCPFFLGLVLRANVTQCSLIFEKRKDFFKKRTVAAARMVTSK